MSPVTRLAAITAAATARCLRISVSTFAFRFLATSQVSVKRRRTPHTKEAQTILVLENENASTTKLSENEQSSGKVTDRRSERRLLRAFLTLDKCEYSMSP
jgi:hypothetical protein